MGVVNLERKEMEIGEVELEAEDYEGDNEEAIHIDPSEIKVEAVPEE